MRQLPLGSLLLTASSVWPVREAAHASTSACAQAAPDTAERPSDPAPCVLMQRLEGQALWLWLATYQPQ